MAALGVAWLAWRNPSARKAVTRGAKFVLVTWLPAYVGQQVREAWANSAPAAAATGQAVATPADAVPTPEPSGPAVAAFPPPTTSE